MPRYSVGRLTKSCRRAVAAGQVRSCFTLEGIATNGCPRQREQASLVIPSQATAKYYRMIQQRASATYENEGNDNRIDKLEALLV